MNLLIVLMTLGIVQGVAEFLPVSSSGHLALLENIPFFREALKGMGENLVLFVNVILHVATLIAVVIFLRKDLAALIVEFFGSLGKRDFRSPAMKKTGYILAACLPAGIIGVLFNDAIERLFGSPVTVCVLLIINGIILISTKKIPLNSRKLEEIGLGRSLLVGLFQAAAILPGISRSGMTITGGFLSGLEPEEAAKFSFLMALPVIGGAGLLETVKVVKRGLPLEHIALIALVMALTIVVALFSLRLLIVMVKKIRLDVFGYYTSALGAAGLVFLLGFAS